MEVWDVRQDDTDESENEPRCAECGGPMVHPEDVADGRHFLCGDFMEWEEDEDLSVYDDDFQPDEGGESG